MLRFLIVLVLAAISLSAQDEARSLAQFQKSFLRSPRSAVPSAEQRQKALLALVGFDSARIAEALVAGWLAVENDIDEIAAERQRVAAELDKLYVGGDAGGQRTVRSDAVERVRGLTADAQRLRQQLDECREVQGSVQLRVQQLTRKDGLLWLLQKVMLDRRYGLPLKIAAGRALGAGAADVMEDLATAIGRAREVEDLLALVEAFSRAGRTAQLHATPVLQLLQHKEEAVRERAAVALSRIAVPDAVAPMIEVLDKATGQSRLRIGDALDVLTGQQFGDNVGAWRAWWAAEGAVVARGEKPLGQGKPSRKGRGNDNYYFGIPQGQSNAILYVIDCSGSMKAELDFKRPGATAAGPNAGKQTRLEACKQELIEALGRLRPQQKFGVLWYSDQPHLYAPKMQLAEPEAVKKAQDFVRTLTPSSSTNIYDSLQTCFSLIGRGAKDKYYGVELDTIFLLTDGSPTKPDGHLDSTDKILEGVRQWNPLQRVTIHCIGIGKGLNAPFLGDLAKENGGEFKSF